MDPYLPLAFDPRKLDTNSTYVQTVNWCEIKHEDKEGVVHTHTFTNLHGAFCFICQPSHEDFQFRYEYYMSGDVIRQRKSKEPLLRGQKIMQATLIYNIKLLDSYNFVSKPQSALPASFWVEDLAKGDFPYLFNQVSNLLWSDSCLGMV